MKIPVFVIHYEAPEWCEASVRSLLASTGVDVDITVVHNGGDVPALPADVAFIRPNRNLGFAGGANLALRELMRSGGEFVVIASHDLIVESDTIEQLVDTARRHPGCGIVGPRYREPKHDRCRTELGHGDALVDAWIGACLMLRRACVESVGTFDEAFGSYLEDVDYCYRARELGWEVRVAPAVADTLGTQSDRVAAIATANWALFELKRAKRLRTRARIRARILAGYGSALAGSIAPWRPAITRTTSASYRQEWRRVLWTALGLSRNRVDHRSRTRERTRPARIPQPHEDHYGF